MTNGCNLYCPVQNDMINEYSLYSTENNSDLYRKINVVSVLISLVIICYCLTFTIVSKLVGLTTYNGWV